MSNDDEVEAIAPSRLPTMAVFGTVAEMLFYHASHAWHWSITQIVEYFLAASHNVLPIFVETSDSVAPGTQMPQHKRSALKESLTAVV